MLSVQQMRVVDEGVWTHRALRGSIQQGLWPGLCLRLGLAEMGEVWLASPRGRAKALGQMQPWTTASSGEAPAMPIANAEAIHAAQGP